MKRICLSILILIFIFGFSQKGHALETSAKGAVLINGTTGGIIWEHNCEERLSMASTTKIMTALLLCESGDLQKQIVTTKQMVTVEGSSMGLLTGDTVSYRDLLYGMMLASGNDAANTTAIAIGGSVENFVNLMNNKALEIGLRNTHFETPSGLDAQGHSSTALDMALLARYALKNEEFRKATSSEYARLCYGNPPYNRTLKNHNKLLSRYEGIIGVKTGYTKKSGRCLVSAAMRDNKYLIAVTLNAPDDWNDHIHMLDYGFENLIQKEVEKPTIPSVSVVGGERDSIKTETDKVTLALTDNEWKNLSQKIYLPRFLYAGVSQGDIVGRVDYIVENKVVSSANIKSTEDVAIKQEENKVKTIMQYFKMLIKAMV